MKNPLALPRRSSEPEIGCVATIVRQGIHGQEVLKS